MNLIVKIFKVLGMVTLLLILTVCFGLVITGNSYVFRGVQLTYLKGENTANIDDYVHFDTRVIKPSQHTPWIKHPRFNEVKLTPTLQQALDSDQTVSFAIIKDGQLLYENYWQGYSAESHTNSFSMAKSINTMLFLKAIEDGYISDVNEPLTKLLPEYKNNEYAKNCTLADLSGMTSGYDWIEDYYFPINPTAKAYYGSHLEQQILNRDFVEPCGSFGYSSGDTQLLGIALKRALEAHGYTISSYLEESFWQPLGMKNEAYWSLDGSKNLEKTYCCVSASMLDFAKFGQLLLNKGKWQGKQILTEDHVDFMITPNKSAFPEESPIIYGHSIWTDMDTPVPFYAMLGHLGQRVLVLPNENVVIVRLGKQKGQYLQTSGFHLEHDLGLYVTEVKQILENIERH